MRRLQAPLEETSASSATNCGYEEHYKRACPGWRKRATSDMVNAILE